MANHAGIHIFKPSETLFLGSLPVQAKPFEDAVELILNYQLKFKISQHHIAWIFKESDGEFPYPPSLSARGLDLEKILFVKSKNINQTLSAVMEENFFSTIVVNQTPNPALLKLAQRYTRKHSPELILKGDELLNLESTRLVIFI